MLSYSAEDHSRDLENDGRQHRGPKSLSNVMKLRLKSLAIMEWVKAKLLKWCYPDQFCNRINLFGSLAHTAKEQGRQLECFSKASHRFKSQISYAISNV